MTREELEEVLKNLKFEQSRIMRMFALNLELKSYDMASENFNILVGLQNLINEYERYVDNEKGLGYINRFGKRVNTQKELEYWNQLFDEIFPKKDNNPTRKL